MDEITRAIRSRNHASLQALLFAGGDPNAIDEQSGESLLAIAAEIGDTESVEQLLEAGADPNALGTTLWPLEAAAGEGHTEIVDRLLFADADFDSVDEDGVTALGCAAAGGHLEIVKLLVEAGADPKHKDRYGNVAAGYAVDNGHDLVVDYLMPQSPPKLRHRLTLRREFNRQKVSQETADNFIQAARHGRLETLSSMLESGVSVEVLATEEGVTALMRAANKGHLKVVRFLLNKGADVNRTDEYGTTALAYAAMRGEGKVYDYLYPLTSAEYRERAERVKEAIVLRKQWKN